MIKASTVALAGVVAASAGAHARCVPELPQMAEIRIEACTPIENEANLMISARIVSVVVFDERSISPLTWVEVEDWASEPAEHFVWTQTDRKIRACADLESRESLFVRIEQPCCDVQQYVIQPDGTKRLEGPLSCIERLREVFELKSPPGRTQD